MSDLSFFREKDLYKVSPLINNSVAWEAFICLLDYKQSKILSELNTRTTEHDRLVRIAAEFQLIQNLRDSKRWITAIQEGLKNGS
jgi:hypothetical protein